MWTLLLGDYWMTTGAALPIQSADDLMACMHRIDLRKHRLFGTPGAVPLMIVRSCLDSGSAE
jgi:hypothetical protein